MNSSIKPYSLGAEISNAIIHGIGFLLALAGLVLLIVHAAIDAPVGEKPFYLAGFILYGSSLVFFFLTSTLYHSLLRTKAYPVFHRLDHAATYVLIAGTYSAYCLTLLRATVGWWLFGAIWVIAVAGISIYSVFGSRLKTLASVTYLIMGWTVLLVVEPVRAALPPESWALLLSGGLVYTGGAVFYLLPKAKWAHPLWHVFVLAGSILHFLSVYRCA